MGVQLTSSRILSVSRLDTMATSSSYSIHRWWICCRVHLLYIVLGTTRFSSLRKPANESSQVFFAGCAAVLVKHYATYAKHSGIPEIKTVLGGFVMRRFMGPWTLAIKSLGLVRTSFVDCYLADISSVSCCCIRPVAWERRPSCSRGLLLR